MSSFRVMPRAYRRQLEAQDRERVKRVTARTDDDIDPRVGSAGRLRGIPAIGRGVSGAIRDTRPGDSLR